MRSLSLERVPLAIAHDYIVGIVPLAVGIVVVVLLIGAVSYGMWKRDREPPVEQGPHPRSGAWHTAEELGRETTSDHGPGHQDGERHFESEAREPDEWQLDGVRWLPHSLKGFGNEGTHAAGPVRSTSRPETWRPAASAARQPEPVRSAQPPGAEPKSQAGTVPEREPDNPKS